MARMGDQTGAYWVFVGIPEGKRALGKPRRRRENTIKMDPQEVGWGMAWVTLSQRRYRWRTFVNAVMKNLYINCR